MPPGLVHFSWAVKESIRELAALTKNFQLMTTPVPAAITAKKTRFSDASGLTLGRAPHNHRYMWWHGHDQFLLRIIDDEENGVVT